MAESRSRPQGAVSPRPPFRPVRLGPNKTVLRVGADGVVHLHSPFELPPFPDRLTDRLTHWAAATPDATFIAERNLAGAWRRLSYAQTLAAVRAIGAALLARALSPERPVAILSGNDIEHALLGLACLYVGIPYAPVSPAYATLSQDFGKLRHIVGRLTPGLVFANDGAAFAAAIAAVIPPDAELVVCRNPPANRAATLFATLREGHPPGPAVEAANRAVGPDTIAKLLFTSGSTGLPKGVINTQRMLTSNQVMLREQMLFLKDEPPVILDWLPWNHTFGGNHNVGLILFNGGALYIDGGKPTPAGIAETVRNLREIAPTIYFNVPKGFEALIPHLRADRALREKFFSRLKLNFYAAAGLSQRIWDALDDIAVETTGERIVMLSGLGATETAPFALVCNPDNIRSGYVGLPCVGLDLKLAPVGDKLEARVKGPSITPGYWREPELTAKAFDEEGYYRLGDALRFVDERDPQQGLYFDGRINEDFKLSTGTWVSVGPLRQALIADCAPLVVEAVIAGLNRDAVTALIFPDIDACRRLAPALPPGAVPLEVLADPGVRSEFRRLLAGLAQQSRGSATRIARAILLDTPASLENGELTDKGSINQKAVLAQRADLVEDLYRVPVPARVIDLNESG